MTTEEPFSLSVDDEPIVPDPRDVPITPEPAKPKTAEELQAALDKSQRDAGVYAAERDAAKMALERIPVATAPVHAAPVVDEAANRQRFETFMSDIAAKQLAGDYDGANKSLLGLVDGLVTEKLKTAQVPIATSGARQAIRNFATTIKDDPMFPKAKQEFERTVNEALPGLALMPPDQQDQAIEILYDRAVGVAARTQARNSRAEDPPPYTTGSPSSGLRPATRNRKLSLVQQTYITSARDAGIPETRIREVLDEMDRGDV
jgi:hypothetical protein